jgi:hypothetical protein
MFPRAYFGGDDTDSTDEDTNFTQTSSSSGLRVRFQDGLNEFKGQRTSKILSQVLISFDNLDEYDEFKNDSDPVFSDDIMKVFSSKDNTDERMTVLDDIMHDIQTDRVSYLTDFTKQDDFISLASSRFNM